MGRPTRPVGFEPAPKIFARVTVRLAGLLGLQGESGMLAPGTCADLAVLRRNEDDRLRDADSEARDGGGW